MNYPFFASFIILSLLLMYEIHKVRNREAKAYQNFWDEENKANSTRKKSLDDLEYIKIPIDSLPMKEMSEDEYVKDYHETIKILSDSKIVNFTGLSNTELKLSYGAANITALSEYDEAYTSLVRTLNDWADILYRNGHTDSARTILEYAVSIKTDISSSYDLLSKIYLESDEKDKIKELIPTASNINSLMSKSIVNMLNERI